MRPTLFSLGPFEFHGYTVMLSIAFLAGVLLAVRENYKLARPYPVTPVGGIWIFVGALVCARAYWILQYDDWRELWRAVFIWQGGMVFYGGLLGGLLGGIIYVKALRVPIAPMGDITMPYLPMAHAIARVGCFLNGCCWGITSNLPWAVRYPAMDWGAYRQHLMNGVIERGAPHSHPVHPTQLYESAGLLVIFVIMRHAFKRPHHTGFVMLLYPLLYGVLRFCIEFLRGDSARPLMDLTASQYVALGMAGGALLVWGALKATIWRGPPPPPPARRGETPDEPPAEAPAESEPDPHATQ